MSDKAKEFQGSSGSSALRNGWLAYQVATGGYVLTPAGQLWRVVVHVVVAVVLGRKQGLTAVAERLVKVRRASIVSWRGITTSTNNRHVLHVSARVVYFVLCSSCSVPLRRGR
jgi:hypothetical protein